MSHISKTTIPIELDVLTVVKENSCTKFDNCQFAAAATTRFEIHVIV